MKKLLNVFLLSAFLLTGCQGSQESSSETSQIATKNTVTDITSESVQTYEISAETTSVTEIPLPSSTSNSQKSIYSVQTSATTEKTIVQSENSVKSDIDITDKIETDETKSETKIQEEYIHNESEISDSENNDVNEGNSAVVNDDGSIDLPVIPIR